MNTQLTRKYYDIKLLEWCKSNKRYFLVFNDMIILSNRIYEGLETKLIGMLDKDNFNENKLNDFATKLQNKVNNYSFWDKYLGES